MILDPAQYGCASKLPFHQTFHLAQSASGDGHGGDFSTTLQGGPYAHSIDKIFRCSDSWQTFADIALNHAFGDVLVAGAKPLHVMIAFEFGLETGEADWAAATTAFFAAAEARGIQVGKCHSNLGTGLTAVTIAVCGNDIPPARPAPTEGLIYLSRPIGAFKMHFVAEMGLSDSTAATTLLTDRTWATFPGQRSWAAVSDVSGDGLAGAVVSMAAAYAVDVDLTLTPGTVYSPDVLNVDVGCLINPEASYENLPFVVQSSKAWHLARLRETAGPFVAMLNKEDIRQEDVEQASGIVLGTYVEGTGKVRIGWRE